MVKNLPTMRETCVQPPGLGRSPGGGLGNPLQYCCLENPYGQRSLVGYSSRGHKELDMTETKHKRDELVKCLCYLVLIQSYRYILKITYI